MCVRARLPLACDTHMHFAQRAALEAHEVKQGEWEMERRALESGEAIGEHTKR